MSFYLWIKHRKEAIRCIFDSRRQICEFVGDYLLGIKDEVPYSRVRPRVIAHATGWLMLRE